MAKKCALVVGGLGLVGRGIVDHLCEAGDWDVIALSRRKASAGNKAATYVAVDCLDLEACRAVAKQYPHVTHVFFTAFTPRPTLLEEVEPNLRMLANIVTAVEENAKRLVHVSLMQGTKAYGTHLGPYKTPARESDPRHMPPNFYYAQEDLLRERAADGRWQWSVMRPRIVCGPYAGTPYNTSLVIAVYAALSKHLRLPLKFPGLLNAYSPIVQTVDTAQLAAATVWAATTPNCAGETFNVTNGGLFRWQHMWPKFAAYFGMDYAPPQAIKFSQMMKDKGSIWDQITSQYGLPSYKFSELLEWEDADFVLNTTYDSLVDATKLIKFGFYNIVDDEEMFFRHFDQFRAKRIIPAA